ncbi:MAG: hypothetical protein GXP31_01755 [Kiritimatiellaeota bacterium]|nr:hypothetical protein [Kiritimatiellota bacterium]
MNITTDWHIHSEWSCDGACMAVPDLVRHAADRGIADFGLTDHIHTPFNLPDLARSRAAFLATEPSPHFHFGVEVSCVSQWELEEIAAGRASEPVYGIRRGGPPGCSLAIGLGQQEIDRFGVEYVVAGTHWPMYVEFERQTIIRDYHRQNMFLALHPLVDIVAHPWWWMGHWKDARGDFKAEPWFDDFRAIPHSMHDEFAAACIQNGTAVEVNISAILLNPHYPEPFVRQYLEYLGDLRRSGVSLAIGSDCHSAHYGIDFERAAALLAPLGIAAEEWWRLSPRGELLA